VVRRITGPARAGVHRIAWNLRYPAATPAALRQTDGDNPFAEPPSGPMVLPGSYKATLVVRAGGQETAVGTPQAFEVTSLNLSTLPPGDKAQTLAFQKKVAQLQRAVLGASALARETQGRIDLLKRAIEDTPGIDPKVGADLRALETRLEDLQVALNGDEVMARRNEVVAPSTQERVNTIVRTQWNSTAAPTGTSQRAYDIAAEEFAGQLEGLRQLVEVDLKRIEAAVEAAGGPWTPGRVPVWKRN
jgi:hypothetical protein